MADVVKIIAVLAQSKRNWEKSLRQIHSSYITEFEASVENGEVVHYRITRRPCPAFFGHGTN
jgi:hypothetical protein